MKVQKEDLRREIDEALDLVFEEFDRANKDAEQTILAPLHLTLFAIHEACLVLCARHASTVDASEQHRINLYSLIAACSSAMSSLLMGKDKRGAELLMACAVAMKLMEGDPSSPDAYYVITEVGEAQAKGEESPLSVDVMTFNRTSDIDDHRSVN